MTDRSPGTGSLVQLRDQLRGIFDTRWRALVTYGVQAAEGHGAAESLSAPGETGGLVHTLALVESLTAQDLRACASLAGSWTRAGLAAPLLLTVAELPRSLDAFPLELQEIIVHHAVIDGPDPFAGVAVQPEDLRRACEVQTRSHLLHLREGYLETGAHPPAVAKLIVASAVPFVRLLTSLAQLEGADPDEPGALARHVEGVAGLSAAVVTQMLAVAAAGTLNAPDAEALFPAYLDGVERLTRYIDGWRR